MDRLTCTITRVESPASIEARWARLEDLVCGHFFLSWSWIRPWLNFVQRHATPFLFEARFEDRTVSVGLLASSKVRRARRMLRVRQLQLNGYPRTGLEIFMPYDGLLSEPEFQGAAWGAFMRTVQEWNPDWDEVRLPGLAGNDVSAIVGWAEELIVLPERTWSAFRVPLLPEHVDLDVLVASMKKKSRQQLRQSLRAFEDRGPLAVREACTLSEALDMFGRLEVVHTRRWTASGKGGSFANPEWGRFHRDVIDVAFAEGQVQLLELSSGGKPFGYLYGHVYGDTVYMHQTGFELEDDNRLRVGYVGHLLAMQHNAARGLRTYDFLPDEPDSYKRFFAEPGEPLHWITLQRPRVRLLLESAIRRRLDHPR